MPSMSKASALPWPRLSGEAPLRSLLTYLQGRTKDEDTKEGERGIVVHAALEHAAVQALEAVHVHTIRDLVRCDFTPVVCGNRVDGSKVKSGNEHHPSTNTGAEPGRFGGDREDKCESSQVSCGKWHDATNAFLANRAGNTPISSASSAAQSDDAVETSERETQAQVLVWFWAILEEMYMVALDLCANPCSVLGSVQPAISVAGKLKANAENEQESTTSYTEESIKVPIGGGSKAAEVESHRMLCLPYDLLRILPTDVDLASRGKTVQISGPRGSGRKTLVLNSVLRSLTVHTEEKALWLCVPDLAEEGGGESQDALARAEASRQTLAWKGVQIQALLHRSIKDCTQGRRQYKDQEKEGTVATSSKDQDTQTTFTHRPDRKRKFTDEREGKEEGHGNSDDFVPEVEDRTWKGPTSGTVFAAAEGPLERLLIHPAHSVEEIQTILEQLYPDSVLASVPWSPSNQPAKATGQAHSKTRPSIVTLEGIERLFIDTDGRPFHGASEASLTVQVQRLMYILVHLARSANLRLYVLNGATVIQSPTELQNLQQKGGLVPLFSTPSPLTPLVPALGGAVEGMLDATYWLTGETVFSFDLEEEAGWIERGAQGAARTPSYPQLSKGERDALGIHERERGSGKYNVVTKRPRSRWRGMRPRVLELHRLDAPPPGLSAQWGIYSSDGVGVYD